MHGVIRSPPSDTAIIHFKDSARLVKALPVNHLLLLSSLRVPKELSLKRDDEIACSAPETSPYSSDERVHVTVKINPNRYTINALQFNFFSVTDASRLPLLVLGSHQEFGRDIETSFLIPKTRHPETVSVGMNTITIKIMEVDDVDESIV
eukprot:scaffold58990_cov85-Cyclotella_meneghiniana.AAC.2